MLENIIDSFRETINVLTSDTDKLAYLFIAPLIITVLITAAFYTIFFNSTTANTFLSLLVKTGACNTNQPYLITALFEQSGVLGYCQIISFNVGVFLAWYAQIFLILFVIVYILINVVHMG